MPEKIWNRGPPVRGWCRVHTGCLYFGRALYWHSEL